MEIHLNSATTLALAALMLITGKAVVGKVRRLREMAIPSPVVGGLMPAILFAVLRAAGIDVTFDTFQQSGLLLAFFATVGLSADIKDVARGGPQLLKFFACVALVIVMQNVIGVAIAL